MTKVQGECQLAILHFFTNYLSQFSYSVCSIDGDSDSLSEFRDISPIKSPMIDENATNLSYKVNGFSQNTNYYNNHQSDSSRPRQNGCDYAANRRESNGSSNDKENKPQTNGTAVSNGFHSSPSRSQLGLNLKPSNAAAKKASNSLSVILIVISLVFSFDLLFHALFDFTVSNLSIFIGRFNRFRRAHKSYAFRSTKSIS